MKPKKLQSEFIRLCRTSVRLGDPLGTEEGQEKKASTYALLYRTAKIQLVYRPRATMSFSPSTLYCRVYPDKNSPLYLHLPQLLPLLEIEDYRACYFSYIENTERMAHCLNALTEVLEPLIAVLENLGTAGGDQVLLEKWIRSTGMKDVEPEKILRRGSDEQRIFLMVLGMEENFHITRYTQTETWYCYLSGQTEKALALYGKQKELTEYEQGLCRFLNTPEGKTFVPMPEACFAQRDRKAVSSGKDDFGTLAKCVLVMYLICAAAGCLLMGVFQIVSSWGTVCWLGAPWWTGFIIGGIPATFGGLALRRKLIPLVSGEKTQKKLEFDDIDNASPFASRLAMVLFIASIIAALWGGALMAGDMIRLYEDHGQYSTGTFEYREVAAVYHIDARHNVYGDRIDRASYVIVLKDGTRIDLDGYASEQQTERKVLPLFEKMDIAVIRVDSDKDLPGER